MPLCHESNADANSSHLLTTLALRIAIVRHPRLRSNGISIIHKFTYYIIYIGLYYLLINSFLFSYSLIINTSVFDPIVNSFSAIPASKLKIKNLCTRFQ